jgi:hypothetical protein
MIKIRSKTGRRRSKTEKDVRKQENEVLKQEICSFFLKILSRDREGCPGIFAPALVPGQRDTGTRKILCPGLSRDVPSRGNPN